MESITRHLCTGNLFTRRRCAVRGHYISWNPVSVQNNWDYRLPCNFPTHFGTWGRIGNWFTPQSPRKELKQNQNIIVTRNKSIVPCRTMDTGRILSHECTNAHYQSEVSKYPNSKHTKYLAQSAADFLRFGKLPPQICESCGATYRWKYETFSAL